jgi:hypothetical protein
MMPGLTFDRVAACGGAAFTLPRWTGWVALVAAIGGASTALLNLGSDITAPLVLDGRAEVR